MNRTKFKLCRHALGMSQSEFAALLGVGRSVVANFETGYRPASSNLITAFNTRIDSDMQARVMALISVH